MTLRIVLNACVRGLRHSFLVDADVIMTRKKRFVTLPVFNKNLQARFCSSGTIPSEIPQTEMEAHSDSDVESVIDSKDTVPVEATQDETVKFLIVGLGNPERLGTRHSVGMNFVDILAKRLRTDWTREKFKHTGGHSASVTLDNKVEIHLLKPRVPMNLNGTSVNKSAHFFSVSPENIYLIHDELGKPVGKFQIKEGGSASGHNGVKSAFNSLKSDVMPRLRIGIDRPANKDDVVDYVLERFEDDEYKLIRSVIAEAIQQLFKHMSEKCGRDLDFDAISRERQSVEYNNPKETEFRFGQRSGYKNKRRDFDRNDRDFRNLDRREFKIKDRRQGQRDFDSRRRDSSFEDRNGLRGFKFEEKDFEFSDDEFDRKNFRQRDRRNMNLGNSRNKFFGDEEFDYDEDDFKPRRKKSVYRSDE